MKIENAIKKLSKYGKIQENGVEWWIVRPTHIIGFLPNGKNITCIYTKRIREGAQEKYCNSLTQAINYILRQEDLNEQSI